jgi:hypothetical protein
VLTGPAGVGQVKAGLLGGVQDVGVVGHVDDLLAWGSLNVGGDQCWRRWGRGCGMPTTRTTAATADVRPCARSKGVLYPFCIDDNAPLAGESPGRAREPPAFEMGPRPTYDTRPALLTAGGLEGHLVGGSHHHTAASSRASGGASGDGGASELHCCCFCEGASKVNEAIVAMRCGIGSTPQFIQSVRCPCLIR